MQKDTPLKNKVIELQFSYKKQRKILYVLLRRIYILLRYTTIPYKQIL